MGDGDRRLVVISGNPTMTWGLTLPGCVIDAVRPNHLREWAVHARDEQVDLILLDMGDSAAAVDGVRALRADARLTPILLIGGEDAGWERQEVVELPGTHLLRHPFDRPELHRTVVELLEIELPSDTPTIHVPVEPEPPHPNGHSDAEHLAHVPSTVSLADRVARSDGSHRPAHTLVARPADVGPAEDEPTLEAHSMMRYLLRHTDKMYGVGETASAVLLDAADRVDCDASCVMLRDELDGQWHVVAHQGLAQVERHMRLSEDSWWISAVVRERQAAIMTNDRGTGFTSTQAPLSRREQLLACAIPGVDGLLLLGRDDKRPFDDADLDSIAAGSLEAGALLADAVDVRSLARLLAPMIERPERLAT